MTIPHSIAYSNQHYPARNQTNFNIPSNTNQFNSFLSNVSTPNGESKDLTTNADSKNIESIVSGQIDKQTNDNNFRYNAKITALSNDNYNYNQFENNINALNNNINELKSLLDFFANSKNFNSYIPEIATKDQGNAQDYATLFTNNNQIIDNDVKVNFCILSLSSKATLTIGSAAGSTIPKSPNLLGNIDLTLNNQNISITVTKFDDIVKIKKKIDNYIKSNNFANDFSVKLVAFGQNFSLQISENTPSNFENPIKFNFTPRAGSLNAIKVIDDIKQSKATIVVDNKFLFTSNNNTFSNINGIDIEVKKINSDKTSQTQSSVNNFKRLVLQLGINNNPLETLYRSSLRGVTSDIHQNFVDVIDSFSASFNILKGAFSNPTVSLNDIQDKLQDNSFSGISDLMKTTLSILIKYYSDNLDNNIYTTKYSKNDIIDCIRDTTNNWWNDLKQKNISDLISAIGTHQTDANQLILPIFFEIQGLADNAGLNMQNYINRIDLFSTSYNLSKPSYNFSSFISELTNLYTHTTPGTGTISLGNDNSWQKFNYLRGNREFSVDDLKQFVSDILNNISKYFFTDFTAPTLTPISGTAPTLTPISGTASTSSTTFTPTSISTSARARIPSTILNQELSTLKYILFITKNPILSNRNYYDPDGTLNSNILDEFKQIYDRIEELEIFLTGVNSTRYSFDDVLSIFNSHSRSITSNNLLQDSTLAPKIKETFDSMSSILTYYHLNAIEYKALEYTEAIISTIKYSIRSARTTVDLKLDFNIAHDKASTTLPENFLSSITNDLHYQTIEIKYDINKIKGEISKLVDSYNALQQMINQIEINLNKIKINTNNSIKSEMQAIINKINAWYCLIVEEVLKTQSQGISSLFPIDVYQRGEIDQIDQIPFNSDDNIIRNILLNNHTTILKYLMHNIEIISPQTQSSILDYNDEIYKHDLIQNMISDQNKDYIEIRVSIDFGNNSVTAEDVDGSYIGNGTYIPNSGRILFPNNGSFSISMINILGLCIVNYPVTTTNTETFQIKITKGLTARATNTMKAILESLNMVSDNISSSILENEKKINQNNAEIKKNLDKAEESQSKITIGNIQQQAVSDYTKNLFTNN
ncbi:hypothetical protein [Rickettsia endosymbiont of Cardiosporidium cionae]|uniref:hypothetical protein n=1 Tax=Rickettsia endosymbiont of Cardiosporidium cionae TaxID=2777155 RepID=UPI00189566A9|nr:hypothetical protein [Rickettsia endosymbiont of Cardiosporidium cionae]KAF8818876.1 hypothetical protein IHI24_000110 [Rickettsia endosymbiont of Cardiosporidium cionae]